MENASFMKKMLMMVAIAMMTTVVLTSCEKDDDSDDWEPSLPSQRTVMVYMAAKNNLAIAASNDISEMEEGMVEVPQTIRIPLCRFSTNTPHHATTLTLRRFVKL